MNSVKFVKLTRLDNTPIWLNAGFIVTVEPRRGGGSVVVPIGDGLDYDVREKPEVVLSMLAGSAAPEIVPVPVSDCLTKTPADVSPEPERPEPKTLAEVASAPEPPPAESAAEPAPEAEAEGKKPARKTARKPRTTARKAKKSAAAEAGEAAPAEAPAAEIPPAETAVAPEAEPPAVMAPRPVEEITLTPDEVERLRKMAPGSIRKLQNTLVAQFRSLDPTAETKALEAHGVIVLDGSHVTWVAPVDEQPPVNEQPPVDEQPPVES